MEIEITTTKKKLTKSIVNQFRNADLSDIEYFLNENITGYYIINLGAKYTEKTGVFKSHDEWVKISLSEINPDMFKNYNFINAYDSRFNFNYKDKETLNKYNKIKKELLKNHLFI